MQFEGIGCMGLGKRLESVPPQMQPCQVFYSLLF